MAEYRRGGHTLYDIKYHLVWITKYRYPVLRGDIALRARELIREICIVRETQIVRGALCPEHVHILVSCPPSLSPSKLVQYIKGRSSRKLQEEFPSLRKDIGVNICGHAAIFARRWGRSMKKRSRRISNPRNGKMMVEKASKWSRHRRLKPA